MLLVVIDTEEEFEWGRGFRPDRTSVHSMRGIGRAQEIFDEFGIRPVYVVDYPIATQPGGHEALREYQDSGRAVIGAHLHPWVNPPVLEELVPRNSYPSNLEEDLLERKLRVLGEAIEESFGTYPTIYKAGRYGLCRRTEAILERLGYEFDLSVCPGVDLGEDDDGPNFLDDRPEPYWFGERRRLLEIPVTAGFVGALARWGADLKRVGSHPYGRAARLPALLGTLRLLDRLRLSPEGMSGEQHRRLTRSLLRRGVRVFTFSFHSPSVCPGYTPYVRTEADLERFLGSCRDYFSYFLGELGGIAATPAQVRELFTRAPSPAAATP